MAKHIDINKLQRRLKQWAEDDEKMKQARLDGGMKATSASRFVKATHAQALINQTRPLYEALTTYLALTNDAKIIIPMDMTLLQTYDDRIDLIAESENDNQAFYGVALRRAVDVVEQAQAGEIIVGNVIGNLYTYLNIADRCSERNRRPNEIEAYAGDDLSEIVADYLVTLKTVKEERGRAYELFTDHINTD